MGSEGRVVEHGMEEHALRKLVGQGGWSFILRMTEYLSMSLRRVWLKLCFTKKIPVAPWRIVRVD